VQQRHHVTKKPRLIRFQRICFFSLFEHSWILQQHNKNQQQNVVSRYSNLVLMLQPLVQQEQPPDELPSSLSSLSGQDGIKQILLQLLQLEQNARKWYGTTLPKAYFAVTVHDQLLALLQQQQQQQQQQQPAVRTNRTMIIITTYLQQQVEQLQRAMYSLSGK
jgi:hypothetical protein